MTTLDQLAAVIEDGLGDGMSPEEMAQAVLDALPGWV